MKKVKRRSSPPWIDKGVMKLVRKKKRLWKKIKSSPSEELSTWFVSLRKQTKQPINANYYRFLKGLSDKLKTDPKQFWSFQFHQLTLLML